MLCVYLGDIAVIINVMKNIQCHVFLFAISTNETECLLLLSPYQRHCKQVIINILTTLYKTSAQGGKLGISISI